MFLFSDSVFPSSPTRLLLNNCLSVRSLLRRWLLKEFILFLGSLQQWFSDTCPSHECLSPFRSLLLYTLDFHPTRYSLRPNHGELPENRKIDKERNVNFIGHKHRSKSFQDGFIVCVRIFCNLKGVFQVCASIAHINAVLVKCRMFLFCLLCEACNYKTTIYEKYKPFPSSKMPFHRLFRSQTASAF